MKLGNTLLIPICFLLTGCSCGRPGSAERPAGVLWCGDGGYEFLTNDTLDRPTAPDAEEIPVFMRADGELRPGIEIKKPRRGIAVELPHSLYFDGQEWRVRVHRGSTTRIRHLYGETVVPWKLPVVDHEPMRHEDWPVLGLGRTDNYHGQVRWADPPSPPIDRVIYR